MASSDNLAGLEPWLFRSAFASDPYFNFSDADILSMPTSAAAAGLSPSDGSAFGSGSGSEPEMAVSKRAGPGLASGRVGKRKPRASKKNPTTYITADAANFRQMVQQVTGVKFPASSQIPPIVLKPDPQRIGGGSGIVGVGTRFQGCLPTLDTSAFLLAPGGSVGSQAGAASTAFPLPSAVEIGCGGGGAAGLVDFDGFSCFPTLDSWTAS